MTTPEPQYDYWFSTAGMTVCVTTDRQGIITDVPPVLVKFKGQPINNLRQWLKKQHDYKELFL